MDDETIKEEFDAVTEALDNCHNELEYRSKLIELGFEWYDDNEPDLEIIEEKSAIPQNDRQQRLVAFFNSTQPPSQKMLDHFLAEKLTPNPNHPLIRRYFRQASKQLKQLLLFGLAVNPIDSGLLDDLAYFNEFSLNLAELIALYKQACRKVTSSTEFKNLAQDFNDVTFKHGYNALHALLKDEQIAPHKKLTIKNLEIAMKAEKETYEF